MTDEFPHIIIPEEGTISKFIQLDIKDKPYFRIIDQSYHHFNLLAKTLDEFDLDFILDESSKPGLIGEEYEVFGMGFVGFEDNKINLLGKSFDYQIGPNEKHLEKLKPYLPEGIEFRVKKWGESI